MADITAVFANLSSTESSNAPAGSTAIGTGLDDNIRTQSAHIAAARDAAGWFGLKLTSVSGTNTVVGAVAAQGSITMAPTAYATGQRFHFIPAATNTGASTLNVSSLGAKNVFYKGSACTGGELVTGVPSVVEYDGTQFNLLSDGMVLTAAEQTTTSGTSIDFTGIPPWVREIKLSFVGVSTNGTSRLMVQIGDSGGIETSGYLSGAASVGDAVATAATTSTAGFILSGAVNDTAIIWHGVITLARVDSGGLKWAESHNLGRSDGAAASFGGGSKSLSAALDRVRVTTVGGTDAFDAGSMNILYS